MAKKLSPGFLEYVLDQLSEVPGLHAVAMFGGIGLYSGDLFFGLIASDILYLKVADANRAAFTAVGSKPFKPYADRPTTMSYYNVPANILEDAARLAMWAADAIDVARHARTTTKSRRRARR